MALEYFFEDVARVINRTFTIRGYSPLTKHLNLFLPPISARIKEQSPEPDLEVVFKNLDGAQIYDAPLSRVPMGKVKLPEGIYPIISVKQKINLREHIKNRDDILVNMSLTVVADPSQKIIFYTDTTLEDLPIAGIGKLLLRSSHILPFLVVKENRWEIKVFKPTDKSMYNIPLGINFHLNSFLPLGYNPIHSYYFLNEAVFEVISNLLWNKDRKPAEILTDLASRLWKLETIKATIILLRTTEHMRKDETLENINQIAEDINENPSYYSFPSSKNYIWVNYEDIISGKYKLQPKVYTITQYHYGKMFIEPPNDNIKPENSIVLDNSIVIYNMPITIAPQFDAEISFRDGLWMGDLLGHVWKINFLFPWPNGYMVIFSAYLLFNPYLEVSTTSGKVIYIPEELSQFLSDIFDSVAKSEKIEDEAKKLWEDNVRWLDWRVTDESNGWIKEKREFIRLKQGKVNIKIDKNPRILKPEEGKKQWMEALLKQSVMSGVITAFCWWPKYTQEAYLLPHIYTKGGFSYSWSKGHVHIFPKPTFLPNQIHIYKPEDIKKLPFAFGVFPVIRYYPSLKGRIVFALYPEEPDTEVVLHYSSEFENILKNVSPRPEEMYGIDFIILWNEFMRRDNIVKVNAKWNNPNHRPSYWEGFDIDDDHTMLYLPEVLSLRLIGEEIEPKQEPFVEEIIAHIQIDKHKEYREWLAPIVEKYKNIPISKDSLEVIRFSDLHKMPGAWFVQEWKRKIGGDNKNNEMVIINMRETSKAFRVKIPWKILQITNSWEPTFITVWPDGTIGWWALRLI